MAFDAINVKPIQHISLTYNEFLDYELENSKNNLLMGLNKEGSIEYYFDGYQLRRKIRSEKNLAKSLAALGFSETEVKDQISIIQGNPIYFDFSELKERYERYLKRFDATTKYDFSNIKIEIGFEPFINAGVRKLKDCYLILVYFGANFIHQWLAEKKMIDYLFVKQDLTTGESVFNFPSNDQNSFISIFRGLRARAKSIFGYFNDVDKEYLRFAITLNGVIHHKTNLHEKIYDERTNILSAEKFILFHELGHIFYGHLEENEHWRQTHAHSEAELKDRLRRRRRMEFEADKFGFDFLMIQTALENNLPLEKFHLHKDSHFNYFNPIEDIFTMFGMAQNDKINFQDEYCPYPSNKERLENLLGGISQMFTFELLTNLPV